MLKQAIILSAVVLGAASMAAAATTSGETRYVTRIVPQGGRFTTILVPANYGRTVETPYALTGRSDEGQRARPYRAIPLNPRGTHNW